MRVKMKKLAAVTLSVSASLLLLTNTVFAHVVVRPAEVVTAGYQTFTVSVPNEKDITTTNVRLLMPEGLQGVMPTAKPGWQITLEHHDNMPDSAVLAITWSGGSISPDLRDDFTFSAKMPSTETELQWKAYQTYADSTVVSWDKAGSGDSHATEEPNTGPYSVTQVVVETTDAVSRKNAELSAVEAKTAADRAMYVGIAAGVIGLVAVFMATRKNV